MNKLLFLVTLYIYIFANTLLLVFLYMISLCSNWKNIKQRIFPSVESRKNTKNIWVHASSIGEYISVIELVNNLQNENTNVVISTNTPSALKLIKLNSPFAQAIYLPYDNPLCFVRFIKKLSPTLVLWVEQDFMPAMLHHLKIKRIPVVLLNGRISNKSYKRWKAFNYIAKNILNSFSDIFAQSYSSKEKLESLSNKKVTYIGNLKKTTINTNINPAFKEKVAKTLKNSPTICFLSTHSNEEHIAFEVFNKLKDTIPNLNCIVIPRHSYRVNEVKISIEEKYNYIPSIITTESLEGSNNFYIANINGDDNIKSLCSLSLITVMGKTFSNTNKGGHNPLEPCAVGSFVIFGPNNHNFIELEQELTDKKLSIKVENEHNLVTFIKNNINNITINPNSVEIFQKEKTEIINKHIELIQPYIK